MLFPSVCDSAPSPYFDRPHVPVSRYPASDLLRCDPPPTAAMNAMSRKRPRTNPPQFTATPRPSSTYDLFNSVSSLDCASPAPLVNTDYCLSGGLDTPGSWSEHRLECVEELDAERDYRQNRFFEQSLQTPQFHKSVPVSQIKLKQHRLDEQSMKKQDGWHVRKAAWALTGGLAEKLFNFCWNTTFRGFEAGGGQGYTNYAEAVTRDSPSAHEAGFLMKRSHVLSSYPAVRASTDTTEPQLAELSRPSRTPVPYNCHISEDSVTKNNWVFIEHNQPGDHDQSPIRKRSKASVAGPGPEPERSDESQPVQAPKPYTASFASPRRTASAASPHARPHSAIKRPRPSLASPSRRQTCIAVTQQSPEIETFQRKRRKEDKKHDDSLKRLNAHLQDMIREGQQALGSKIEILDDHDHEHDTDEGYYDDELR